MPSYLPIAERLIKKVDFDPTTHCMNYTGPRDKCGYGKATGGRDIPGETLAHRCAYIAWNGPIPDGMEIDHRCNNRACINPQHLDAVPHGLNVKFSDHRTNHPNGVKTHCIRGHAFTLENTVWETYADRKQRKCRRCRLEQQRVRKAKTRDIVIVGKGVS